MNRSNRDRGSRATAPLAPAKWRSLAEREHTLPVFDGNADLRSLVERASSTETTRRTFLEIAGFGVAAMVAACTRAPIEKAIPLLVKSEDVVPGKSYWIATTCGGCPAGCGALAKCRDGRPIKLEGTPRHPVSGGGLCAVGQALVLSLYDSQRLDGPRRGGAKVSWSDADRAIGAALEQARASGGKVRVLTNTHHSPSTRAAIGRFLASFRDAKHVEYDALSCSALLDAQLATRGVRALPRFHFDRARTIVAFDADFLGTWISPVEFTAARPTTRDPSAPDRFARHVQFEPRMTLTGSRADRRVKVAPSQVGPAVAGLARRIAKLAGDHVPASAIAAFTAKPCPAPIERELDRVAEELWRTRGASLVVCGANDVRVQKLVAAIGEMLGSHSTASSGDATIELATPSQQRRGDDAALANLRAELESGAVDVLVVADANPLHELPRSKELAAALARTKLVVVCASHLDETAAAAHFVLPTPHFLEAWNDGEPVAGVVTLSQPTLPPLRDARTLRRTLSLWSGETRDDRELVKASYDELVAKHTGNGGAGAVRASTFELALQEGFAQFAPSGRASVKPFDFAALEPIDESTHGEATTAAADGAANSLELALYAKVGMPDGRHAHNAWLQELPDPVTKVVWDNYACVAPATAKRLGLVQGDVVRLSHTAGTNSGESLELPILVQPGQHEDVVAVALNYGRSGTERFTKIGPQWLEARPTVAPGGLVGRNAAPLIGVSRVTVAPTGARVELACTQDHHTLEIPDHLAPSGGAVRDAALATTLAQWVADPKRAIEREAAPARELWPKDHPTAGGPRWGMAIDLSACTGCSACVVGCQAENNVPVVGRDEVRRHREMQWIRIDRYYQGDPADPTTLHQPMLCQHCEHAPCETVCPVLATVHSREGLNQQVYNRCVGTRYCANNCPYKVRRFNWFDYPHDDALANHTLNPDVTVRSRGVMEKCSLCVQRILEAKIEGRVAAAAGASGASKSSKNGVPADGSIQTACQQSCPAQAIVFGDLNDPNSRVAKLARSDRSYTVLGELGVKPGVHYLAAVHDREPAEGERHG